MTVRVRPAGPDDVDVVAALEAESLGVDAWSHGLVALGVRGDVPTVQYLLAVEDGADEEDGGAAVGHAVVSVAGDIAELQRIAVTPSWRRRGVAGALLAAAVAAGRAGGADRLLLEVREDNSGALAFYAAHGFVEIDRRRRYYRDGTTAVVLRLPLVTGCG